MARPRPVTRRRRRGPERASSTPSTSAGCAPSRPGVGDVSPALFDLDSPDGIVAHPVYPRRPRVAAGPRRPAGPRPRRRRRPRRPPRQPRDRLDTGRSAPATRCGPPAGSRPSSNARPACSRSSPSPPPAPTGSPWSSPTRASSTAARPSPTRPAGPAERRAREPGPVPRSGRPRRDEVGGFRVEPADAVVYSECSGIWNPIHTDPRAARLAGLPRPVLHGTATLARDVSALVEARLGGDPTRVARLGCRFTAPIAPATRDRRRDGAPRRSAGVQDVEGRRRPGPRPRNRRSPPHLT